MTFKIVTSDERRTTFHRNVQLDLTRDTAILIRQSRRGSHIAHYESRLLQESLIPFVMEARGESDLTHTRIYDEGSGVSGRKGIDKRLLLRQLHYDLAGGFIGDIVLARVDRLFRDKHFQNVSTFTTLAEKMGIKVIVPATQGIIVYDLKYTKDLQTFQQDMQAAYAYVDNQIGYMNRARDYKMSRGLYGGGCLPLPYVLLRDMRKDEQVPVIYHPWLEYALDLFTKFTEFNYEIGRIARYVEDKPFIFPSMPADDFELFKPVTNMRQVAKGYTFSSTKTLLYYLSNLSLAGYAHGGKDEDENTLLIAGAFDAAIPIEILEPAYAAINGEFLDGTPFAKIGSTRQYRRTNIETDAILHGLLTSDDGTISAFAQIDDNYPIYACLKGGYLGQKTRAGLGRVLKAWTLPGREVDRIILERLIAIAEYDQDMVARIKKFFDEAGKEGESNLEVLDTAIKNTLKAIQRLSKTIVLLTKGNVDENGEEIPLDENDPIVTERRGLQVTLRRLQQQREEAAREANEDPSKSISDFYYVLSHLRSEFNKKSPQTKKDIIRKLVEEVKINAISPHLYSLQITWIEPMTSVRDDVALLWRSDPTKSETTSNWTLLEEEAVRTLYPHNPQLDIMQAIPDKTPGQIKKKAYELGVQRDYWHIDDTQRFYWTVSYTDLQIAAQFTDSAKQREMLWREINAMAAATKRGQLTASWFMPVDMISFIHAFDVTSINEGGLPRILV